VHLLHFGLTCTRITIKIGYSQVALDTCPDHRCPSFSRNGFLSTGIALHALSILRSERSSPIE